MATDPAASVDPAPDPDPGPGPVGPAHDPGGSRPESATVLLPRSLLQLFPGVERRHEVDGSTVGALIDALETSVPGIRDRLVEAGPRLRPHINVFVAGQPASLDSPVHPGDTVHVIPAVSGG